MNNPSPLLPQSSFLEQKNQGRARVKIAVFVVLAVHGIGLLALLMQGCKKEPDAGAAVADATTNTAPAFVEPTNAPVADTNIAAPGPDTNAVAETAAPAAAAAAASEYKIAAGDTFSTIAKKFHTTTKAILDANPGVEPTRLKVGQVIHLPAISGAPAPATALAGSATEAAGAEPVYTVKSGDNLTKIATEFKVSVRALRSANNLTTDRIRVGQKLKIPAKAPAAALTSAPPPMPAVPSDSAPMQAATSSPSSTR